MLHHRQAGLFRLKTTPVIHGDQLDLAEEGLDDGQEARELNEVKSKPVIRRCSSDTRLVVHDDTHPLTLAEPTKFVVNETEM